MSFRCVGCKQKRWGNANRTLCSPCQLRDGTLVERRRERPSQVERRFAQLRAERQRLKWTAA